MKVDFMRKKNGIFAFSLVFVFLCICLSIPSFGINHTLALVGNRDSQFSTNPYDRNNWKWTPTEVVSTESTTGAVEPSLAVDSKGNVHLSWHDLSDYGGSGPDYDIFYKCWNSSTSAWMNLEVVSTESVNGSGGPSLAVDSYDNVHISWNDESNYTNAGDDWDIFYKKRDASLSTWSLTEVVSTESTEDSLFPTLAVDNEGNVHISWEDLTDYLGCGTLEDIFYKRWEASSSSWTTTIVVSTDSVWQTHDPSLTVDAAGSVYIAWSDYSTYNGDEDDYDIVFRRRDVATSSWKAIEFVSNGSIEASTNPSIVAYSVGQLHLVWNDLSDMVGSGSDYDVFYRTWELSSASWSPIECVSTESSDSIYDSHITVDSSGTVHIAWSVANNILYKRLEVISSSWTITELVSTESSNVAKLPCLATDSKGVIYTAWQDKSNYTDAGTDFDIFYKKLIGLPSPPELAFIDPNPTESNIVYLDWNDLTDILNYYIYRSTSYIWSVEGLVPLATATSSDYADNLPDEGDYYYVIVAENYAGNSTHSNCQYVEYTIPHLREIFIPIGLSLGLLVALSVIVIRKKGINNSKK